MKCYYEELGVERDANESEIKSAYRKLALKWHPDKNPECMEKSKERFQLIQQAYEVLSDPQERAWYNNHREKILRGKNSDYEDSCLDVFQYFTVSCFKGYGDDHNGFYAIYREVFKKISAEDAVFMECEEELLNIPKFGDSKSSYEDCVGPFYAFWSAYCTKRTYAWLCPYDIKEVKDRRILREIEKDMKKVVQKAKKERNEEVRNLVSFVRKRDKRVQAYKKVLEERSSLNRQKHEQKRLEQVKRRQQELEEMRQNRQTRNANDDYEEMLQQLEQQYSSDDDCDEDISELDEQKNPKAQECIVDLYCVACNKEFKTERALANHEVSKKHRHNFERLRIEMLDKENLTLKNSQDKECELNTSDSEENQAAAQKSCSSRTSATKINNEVEYRFNDYISEKIREEESLQDSQKEEKIVKTNDEFEEIIVLRKEEQSVGQYVSSSKTKKKSKKVKKPNDLSSNEDISEENRNLLKNVDNNEVWDTTKKPAKKCKSKNKVHKNKQTLSEEQSVETETLSKSSSLLKSERTQHICATCKSEFESKNKLFVHLKLTNHSVFISKTDGLDCQSRKNKGKN